eukprot:2499021-Prymnesium_polylepis.1
MFQQQQRAQQQQALNGLHFQNCTGGSKTTRALPAMADATKPTIRERTRPREVLRLSSAATRPQ